MSRRYALNTPAVIHETVDHETIVVNLETGSYYALNRSGSYVLGRVLEGSSADEIAAEHDAALAPTLHDFVERLVAEHLVVPRNGAPVADGTGAEPPAGPAFDPPELHCYTDMQELLLLDPVHEVGLDGWPQRQ
jgi:hypothetical protein